MKVVFSSQAWDDYLYWRKADQSMLRRINALIKDIQRNPCDGIGKPEPLKHNLSGYWSRRMNHEHRIVYKVADDQMFIAQLRYYYVHDGSG